MFSLPSQNCLDKHLKALLETLVKNSELKVSFIYLQLQVFSEELDVSD